MSIGEDCSFCKFVPQFCCDYIGHHFVSKVNSDSHYVCLYKVFNFYLEILAEIFEVFMKYKTFGKMMFTFPFFTAFVIQMVKEKEKFLLF